MLQRPASEGSRCRQSTLMRHRSLSIEQNGLNSVQLSNGFSREVAAAMAKKACLIYVTATAGMKAGARARLEAEGYEVCEVLADLDDAAAAEAGQPAISPDLKACIDAAELCIFLLPEDGSRDGGIGAGGSYASELGKPVIAVATGSREAFPQVFDADSAGIVHHYEDGLLDAIRGDTSFNRPDGSKAPPRKTDHVKCQ